MFILLGPWRGSSSCGPGVACLLPCVGCHLWVLTAWWFAGMWVKATSEGFVALVCCLVTMVVVVVHEVGDQGFAVLLILLAGQASKQT
jgi:hypothetical protein